MPKRIPNPDLAVGEGNKQRWNQPEHRRHGFHNAHRIFRRTLTVRSREVLPLKEAEPQRDLAAEVPGLKALVDDPAFSAFCCIQDDRVVMEAAAADFGTDAPHSIQSISKLHIHIVYGWLFARGLVSPDAKVSEYLDGMGSGYAEATVQALLDMAVVNDFNEDYMDPEADSYTEEMALGWRLPAPGEPEPTLAGFAAGITGFVPGPYPANADYKSANTDVLTLVAEAVSPVPLARLVEEIADAAGYEGAFHISLSPERLPTFSGGGCLSARDLARFGRLFVAGESGDGSPDAGFLRETLDRAAPPLNPPRDWLKYSNHTMTDGRLVCHAGYGGQFLMADTEARTVCAFLSVLENEAGYDVDYMGSIALALRDVCRAVAG